MAKSDKPFRIRVIETRCYEFEVWAPNGSEAQAKGVKIWNEAPTVGQWETDATEYEYEASEIMYEPGALPVAHT